MGQTGLVDDFCRNVGREVGCEGIVLQHHDHEGRGIILVEGRSCRTIKLTRLCQALSHLIALHRRREEVPLTPVDDPWAKACPVQLGLNAKYG